MSVCSKCRSPSVIFLRYAGTHLCREHFLEFFARRAKLEIARQGRLPEGTVAVALSGGKDSVSVLHFLHQMLGGRPGIRLVAVTVDEGIAGYRDSALDICREVTKRLGVPWTLVKTEELAGYSIDQYAAGTHGPGGESHTNAPRAACGPCGVFRRVGMNRLARDAGASAIVTGHNLDDQAQTILMNHLKGDLDRASRMAPHDQGDRHDGLVPRLMPFRTIPEKEVLLYAVLNDLPLHHEAECPYAERSQRFALRDVLTSLEERTPGTRHALVRGQDRLQPILLAALPKTPLASCPECGEATSGERCMACALRA
ncbi:MAG: TIGR00269 family protein [bacterium]